MSSLEPPRLARRLLARALPEDAREHIDGDLLEVYARRCAEHGVTRARLWYCKEAASFSARFLVERLRSREPRESIRWSSIAPSALDLRLGLRMLVKYPGLSFVSVTGMAVAIAIGAISFSVIAVVSGSRLPLPDGDRIVALRNIDVTEPGRTQTSLRDFLSWRDQLKSVKELSAFRTTTRNLVIRGSDVDLVRVARMTASGFTVARTAPFMGRPLLDEDERTNARVVVIGFDEWQQRFSADPQVIGRDIGLGSERYTIVGVMPEGFRFPVADRFWIPLHFTPAERAVPEGIKLTVFGRLGSDASVEGAQAELTTIGARISTANPATHERLRPEILSYPRAFFDTDGSSTSRTTRLFPVFVGLLLVVVAVNVAILVYARTATRVGEIAVRTALGASRARVVTQLFSEALVLSLTAAVVGLTVTAVALAKLQALIQSAQMERRIGQLPFWMELGLSPGVIGYVLVLALVGAAIIGVVPALRATGRDVSANLQRLSGHGARMELGRAWTALIVAQVAIAVAVLPFGGHFAEEAIADTTSNAGYPAEEFLDASLSIQRADGTQDTSTARAAELMRRLESDPTVAGLTVRVRGDERIEIEDIAAPRAIYTGWENVDRVDENFFALYGLPIMSGRAFTSADARAAPTAVIVNQVFVEDNLGTSSPLGRHIRFVRGSDNRDEAERGPWLEVVGVVRDFQANAHEPQPHVYLPTDVASLSLPIGIAIKVRTSPATRFIPRLRELATAVDPDLQLDGLGSAAELRRERLQVPRYFAIGTTAVMLSGLLLSAAGIYAMMSFTVTRRRREIGIRSALGAAPGRVLRSIFARASAQLGAGIALGLIGTIVLDRVMERGPVNDGNSIVLVFVLALMITIGFARRHWAGAARPVDSAGGGAPRGIVVVSAPHSSHRPF